MPTEFVGVTQSAGDWLAGARLHNRSKYGDHTYRVGWSYVLATGVEDHSGELVTLDQSLRPEESFSLSVPIKFDVVSFRRADKPGSGRVFPAEGDFIAYHGAPMHDLLTFAYQHKGYFLVSNEPQWVKDEYWEFEAKEI